mgnify:CR=1 FL=1
MVTNQQILDSYTVSTAPREILDIILKSGPTEQSFMWQSYPDKRVVFRVKMLEVDSVKHKVKVAYDGSGELVDPERPIYVKISFRETVFKGKVTKLSRQEVALDLPHEVRMREFRETIRQAFPPGKQFITMRPYVAHMRPDQLPSMKLNLKDVSLKGLGIFVSDANAHFFKKGKFIELVSLGQFELPRPLLAQVVYVTRQRGGRHELHRGAENRIGLKMLDEIPSIYLEMFTKNASQLRAPLDELLNSDMLSKEFKDMLGNEVSRTIKKIKQRPALAKYLNQLDLIRGEDDYLSEHIQVLGLICTFMARSMNWVSEASMEKFIYAAYIHDAPLFRFPRLARIHSKQDFEARRGQLSPEEQSVFLSAPEVAGLLATQDPQAPPDVESMLTQQKELPDGSGFPLGITQSKFTPMAALFIVAHSLTDEVMTNPEWSLEQWLPHAKMRYKGGHFNKVLTALESVKITLKR